MSRRLPLIAEARQARSHSNEQVLLARADLLLLLAHWLDSQEPVDAAALDGAALLQLLATAEIGSESELVEALLSAAQACSTVSRDAWASAYASLFGPELSCPPYEAAFVRRDKGVLLADIAGFYRAFGFAARAGERPDHVCMELELVALLHVSLARARAEHATESAQVVADALTAFVAEHLGDWLPAFARKLARAASLDWHLALAGLLLQAAGALGCASVELDEERASESAPSESPYECGLAEASAAEG